MLSPEKESMFGHIGGARSRCRERSVSLLAAIRSLSYVMFCIHDRHITIIMFGVLKLTCLICATTSVTDGQQEGADPSLGWCYRTSGHPPLYTITPTHNDDMHSAITMIQRMSTSAKHPDKGVDLRNR
jgi:hypothetical protein